MAEKIIIDPITRIEGHMKVEAVVDDGEVKDAQSSGTLFRGIELIMQGRDPRDAPRIAQRICGVCPATHSVASTQCVDSAFGITDKIPENGRIIRNLILGSNYIQSHILHFYHLAALDYVDVTKAADYVGNDPTLSSVKDFIGRGTRATGGPALPVGFGVHERSCRCHFPSTWDTGSSRGTWPNGHRYRNCDDSHAWSHKPYAPHTDLSVGRSQAGPCLRSRLADGTPVHSAPGQPQRPGRGSAVLR